MGGKSWNTSNNEGNLEIFFLLKKIQALKFKYQKFFFLKFL